MPDGPKQPISPTAAEFGRRVRQRRLELALSQESLAEGSRLHWSYIGRVERGQVNLTLHTIIRLADTLGIAPEDLIRDLPLPPE